jgi:hypothetical protein
MYSVVDPDRENALMNQSQTTITDCQCPSHRKNEMKKATSEELRIAGEAA